MLVASCHESFNIIYEDVVEKDPNVIPPENVDIRKVNILPTLSDPLYTIDMPAASEKEEDTDGEDTPDKDKVYGKDYTTATRGAYGTWEEDKAHWLSTRFHTFGLRSGNMSGGNADYEAAKNGDQSAGVLWDQILGIYDQHGHTQFFNEEGKVVDRKYDIGDNLYRYKFFLLGMDNKPVDFHTEEGRRVVASVQLDGSHDILHSFAYHTDEQYDEAVQQAPQGDAMKVFLGGGKDYMYNRLSGYLGMHPIFNVNHLLSRFDVYVKGAVTEDTPRGDFLKIIITDVELKAYNNVDIVVADDSWERTQLLPYAPVCHPVWPQRPYRQLYAGLRLRKTCPGGRPAEPGDRRTSHPRGKPLGVHLQARYPHAHYDDAPSAHRGRAICHLLQVQVPVHPSGPRYKGASPWHQCEP